MKRTSSLALVLIVLTLGPIGMITISYSEVKDNSISIVDEPLSDLIPDNSQWTKSEIPVSSGVVDPIAIEQAGYIESENLSARTDTSTNTEYSLTIDEANGWVGSVAEVDVWNLNRLYAVNGSFDEGIPGKNPNPGTTNYYPYGWSSLSSGSENQYASYVQQANNYVTAENQGDPGGLFSDYFDHDTGSYVIWYQTVENTPSSTQFVLSFDYLYLTGPIYNTGGDNPGGYASIIVSIDGTIEWSLNLLDLDERNLWYETGDISLNLPSVGSSFTFAIGIYVYDGMRLYPDNDYDNDGSADGAANTGTILVHFDDVSLVGNSSPDLDQIDLNFQAGSLTTPIIGTNGSGSALISNPTLWTEDPLTTLVTSNTTVEFEYNVRLLSHRFINSTWSTDTANQGVLFETETGESPVMSLFAYVGIVDPYQDFFVNIIHPVDWENVTVYDPFRNNVTEDIVKGSAMCTIPTSLVTRLGWWEIILNAPNYAEQVITETYDGTWSSEATFRSSDIIRGEIEIGTTTSTPVINDQVDFQWIMPNGTVWSTDSVPGSPTSLVNSGQRTLGGTNTTAGEWTITAFWTNGSAIAYGSSNFDVYHSTSVELVYPDQDVIETEFGLTISNLLYYKDADNNQFIVDEITSITANWSSSTVTFTPNFVKNWYEADFNTSLLTGGSYLVVVNVSRPYYDDTSITFRVDITYETTLEITNIGDIPVKRGLDQDFPVHFEYRRTDGTGIAGADIVLNYSSTYQGLERNTLFDYGNGSYTLHLSANTSDTYSVIISAARPFHKKNSDSFTVIVDEIITELVRLNGTSNAIQFGDNYTLVVRYSNSSGYGLQGADIDIISINPSVGLPISLFVEGSDGQYSVLLEPLVADVYTIVIRASLANHETQFTTFTLTVSEIPTILSAIQPPSSVAYDQNYTVNFRLQDEQFNGLSNATISIIDLPSGLFYVSQTDWLNGTYTILIMPLEEGTYDLQFRAYLMNYQNSTEAVSVFVTSIPTQLQMIPDVTSVSTDFYEQYEFVVLFNRSDLGSFISGADIVISSTSMDGLFVPIVTEYSDHYTVVLQGYSLDVWQLVITANRTGYRTETTTLLFEVVEIETSIEGSNPAGNLIYGRQFILIFNYIIESNSTGISGATVTPLGESADWVSSSSPAPGEYTIQLTPLAVGSHEVLLTFERMGFETRTFRLIFSVSSVPIEVVFMSGLSGLEGSTGDLVIRLVESDTQNPVSEAFVRYLLFDDQGGSGDFVTMTESSDGQYAASIVYPGTGRSYSVQIFVDLDNYELEGNVVSEINPETNLSLLVYRTVRSNLYLFVALGAVVIGFAVRSVSRRKQFLENIEAQAIKRRFDDVRDILGVIVLHKESGLSLYSKILRGGVDESIIAAFISAIRNFRMEFDIENGADEHKIVPISDIIRVITTKNLVVAFIVLNNPSRQQRLNMLTFSRKIGIIFDEVYKDTPMVAMDDNTNFAISNLFDEVMDGYLQDNYELAEGATISKATQCVIEAIENIPGDAFKLERVASEMTSCGFNDAQAYKLIMFALDEGIIIPSENKVLTEEDLFIEEVEGILASAKENEDEERE